MGCEGRNEHTQQQQKKNEEHASHKEALSKCLLNGTVILHTQHEKLLVKQEF